ncbi:hypothetical protein [Bdellovibrio sp. HCB2-146]|uniref:hypothetical protein n=1 Tax=Bdellovibrio sp. HCB2-146 TaxID=3394362 RepID=UPI0039BC9D5E
MKKMILTIGFALTPVFAFAGEVINTKVNCTTSSNPQVFTAEAQEYQSSYIQLKEYQLWPLNVGGQKNLLISKDSKKGTYAYLTLGDSKSSSVFVSLPLENGDVQNCIVLMTKVKGEKPYIWEPGTPIQY